MTPAATHVDTLVLNSPDALVTGLPYLLGFAPVESAVLLWLDHRRLLLTQRIDLPPDDSHIDRWLTAMWQHVAAQQADELIVVLVTMRHDAADLARRIEAVAAEREIRIRDSLVVNEGRWRSLLCADESCCDPAGRPVDTAVSDRIAAEFAVIGVAPVHSREDVVREFDPSPVENADVAAAIGEPLKLRGRKLETWRDGIIDEIVGRMSTVDTELDAVGVASILVGLHDVRIRDTVLWELSAADQASRFRALSLLTTCTRMAPPDHVAPASTCAAIAAWLVGDGARAQVALERALDDRPDYGLALLVRHSVTVGLPPASWREAVAGLSREECRTGTAPAGRRPRRRPQGRSDAFTDA